MIDAVAELGAPVAATHFANRTGFAAAQELEALADEIERSPG